MARGKYCWRAEWYQYDDITPDSKQLNNDIEQYENKKEIKKSRQFSESVYGSRNARLLSLFELIIHDSVPKCLKCEQKLYTAYLRYAFSLEKSNISLKEQMDIIKYILEFKANDIACLLDENNINKFCEIYKPNILANENISSSDEESCTYNFSENYQLKNKKQETEINNYDLNNYEINNNEINNNEINNNGCINYPIQSLPYTGYNTNDRIISPSSFYNPNFLNQNISYDNIYSYLKKVTNNHNENGFIGTNNRDEYKKNVDNNQNVNVENSNILSNFNFNSIKPTMQMNEYQTINNHYNLNNDVPTYYDSIYNNSNNQLENADGNNMYYSMMNRYILENQTKNKIQQLIEKGNNALNMQKQNNDATYYVNNIDDNNNNNSNYNNNNNTYSNTNNNYSNIGNNNCNNNSNNNYNNNSNNNYNNNINHNYNNNGNNNNNNDNNNNNNNNNSNDSGNNNIHYEQLKNALFFNQHINRINEQNI